MAIALMLDLVLDIPDDGQVRKKKEYLLGWKCMNVFGLGPGFDGFEEVLEGLSGFGMALGRFSERFSWFLEDFRRVPGGGGIL